MVNFSSIRLHVLVGAGKNQEKILVKGGGWKMRWDMVEGALTGNKWLRMFVKYGGRGIPRVK